MAVREVLLFGNKILRKKSAEVNFDIDEPDRIIADLADTLMYLQHKKRIGRALAAPQIGYFKRIVYMETAGGKLVMINPVITERSHEVFEVWDSCFSAEVAFFGRVLRNRGITVEYYDENRNKVLRRFEGDLSELFQHEIDHLDGILFTDYIVGGQIIMRSEWDKL